MARKADPDSLKKCAKCGEYKIRKDGFYFREGKGWDSRCKECRITTRREWTYAQRAAQPPKGWRARAAEAPDGTRWCPRCESYVELSEFYKYGGKYVVPCKECQHKEHKETYVPKNPGLWRGRPKMTPEQKENKRKLDGYRASLRLRGYHGPYHTWEEWQALLDATGRKCLKCGKIEDHTVLTRDHVIPLSAGGTDEISNIQPLCIYCNARKQKDRVDYRNSPDEFPGAD